MQAPAAGHARNVVTSSRFRAIQSQPTRLIAQLPLSWRHLVGRLTLCTDVTATYALWNDIAMHRLAPTLNAHWRKAGVSTAAETWDLYQMKEFVKERWLWAVGAAAVVVAMGARSGFQEFGFSLRFFLMTAILVGIACFSMVIAFPIAYRLNRVIFPRRPGEPRTLDRQTTQVHSPFRTPKSSLAHQPGCTGTHAPRQRCVLPPDES